MIGIKAAQRQVLDVVHDLDAIRFRLLGVQASLPPGALERDRLLEMEGMDPVTELRAAIDCALRDSLEPLIRDLKAAAPPASPGGGDSEA